MPAFFRYIINHLFYRQYLPHKPTQVEIESEDYLKVRANYFTRTVAVARKHQTISSALLQRELKIPYSISWCLLDLLEYDQYRDKD
jgi:hypothetical protein